MSLKNIFFIILIEAIVDKCGFIFELGWATISFKNLKTRNKLIGAEPQLKLLTIYLIKLILSYKILVLHYFF